MPFAQLYEYSFEVIPDLAPVFVRFVHEVIFYHERPLAKGWTTDPLCCLIVFHVFLSHQHLQ